MPTKYKNRLQRIRDIYAAKSDYEKSQAQARYALNSDAVIERSTARMQTDTTSRNKNRVRSASYTKKRIADDVQYWERNRVTAAQSKIRRLETDEAYHAAHVESAKEYKKKKLQNDEKYHAVHVKSAKEYKKKKLQSDEKYHAAHVESAKEYKTKRLQSDKKYHAAHVKSAKDYKKKKLQTNVNYRYQNLQSTKNRLETRFTYTSSGWRVVPRRGCRAGRRIQRQRMTSAPVSFSISPSHHRTFACQNLSTTTPSPPQRPIRRLADVRTPSLYVLNAAALSKPTAVEHLAAELTSYDVDVAVITETHFKAKHSDSVVGVDRYDIFRRDRARRRGGGVALCVRSTIQSSDWTYSGDNRTYEIL